jgi:hypothetical protein
MAAIVPGSRLRAAVVSVVLVLVALPAAASADPPSFNTVKIAPGNEADTWVEPRIATGPDGALWAVTNDKDGTAIVLVSHDGGKSFQKTDSTIPGQASPSPDVDVVVLPTGRVIATELDRGGVNFPTAYSDDGGKTFTSSLGSNTLADQDRQWLTAGPPDKDTHKSPVYLLFHNLVSGNGQHNMFVARSDDEGASFGPPVPITLPGDAAYNDLQCADSGGPSTIFVNQNDGTVYAEFTTRGTPIQGVGELGGCATPASGQPIEFNIVAGTRVWFAQSKDGGVTWTKSLPVDDAATGQIVSMQVAYAGLDTAGNVYVAYPESPLGRKFPDYSGAGVKFKWAHPADDAANLKWSPARTFAPADPSAPGHVLVHMTVGDPGQLMGAYWTGEARAGKDPAWYMTAAQTANGLSDDPTVTETRISGIPTDGGTATTLMGACRDDLGPFQGIFNGLICNRSPDVWGVTVDHACMTSIVWPAVDVRDDPGSTDDDKTAVAGSDPGTYVSTQTGGPSLCGQKPGSAPPPVGSAGCPDRIAPVSRFRSVRVRASRRRLRFRGSSRDVGCTGANGLAAAGKVARVDLSVAKVRGKGEGKNCRFLTKAGKLTAFRRCRRPVLLRARGTRTWNITLKPHRLPAGSYRAVVRGVDAAKNKEKPTKGRNILSFGIH